jgi:hypothetical protein
LDTEPTSLQDERECKMTIQAARFACVTTLLVCAFMASTGNVVANQVSAPVPNRPRLGIHVNEFRMNTPNGIIRGVRVVSDEMGKYLYREDGEGRRMRFNFRVGYDVILEINGDEVRNVNDLRGGANPGWNTLRIWDRQTGRTAEYEIKL